MQSMARRLGFCSLVAFGAPLTEENAFWNVNLERRHVPEEYRGGWANHSYFPSPEDWRALSIYQLLTDRFADGDPRNNELAAGGFDVRDMTLRHGGDFKGLTQKLHYIKGLGCRGIWISPIFQNGENSYHQYSQLDFTLLDRRLGTLEELRALTSAAHALGIYVIVDVVMNHMSNEFFFEGHEFGAAPWRFHEDAHGEREYLLRPRRPAKELQQTPAGRQPYMDFWYNNSWDPTAQYPGTLYGQHGEKAVDVGHGTYDSSDFHHNGDLKDYYDPFQIHYGKLYGTMDDLRLEHRRVQAKYIAMTKALISSCDVDGFRVDTPMQVPLVFYKAWAPAMRKHALGLGKKSFGLFGEFYVTPERYATMTGRGKDQAMYGTESFIEGPATMKGGIVYSYYWYMFTAFVYNQPQYADGFPLAYAEESNMLDTYDEASGQKQYAMWNFCNNHDNWRLQAMTSTRHLLLCLVVITFWPGIPLHYAGDEQNLGSPGSALDGWSREELGSSLAWQAVTVTPSGNPADGDNFDMTAPNYLFIARLNALRRSYFGDFGREECDKLVLPESPIPDVLAFSRGCTEEGRVLVVANFHGTAFRSARLRCKWPKGTKLQDTLEPADPLALLAGEDGEIALQLRPLQSLVLAPAPLRRLPPVVVSVSPSHGAVLAQLQGEVQLRIRFDRPMQPTARAVTLDGEGIFSCLDDTCQEVGATVQLENLCDGTHRLEAPEGLAESLSGDSVGKTEASFRSYFIVDRHSGIVAEPRMHEHRGLICDLGRKLCHNAAGAGWLRIRDVGGNWTAWRPYEEQSDWRATKGVGVLVQYHAEGSASFIAGDCMVQPLQRCHSSWHRHMHLRGDFNQWGEAKDLSMQKVEHFTWAANFTTDTFVKVKFAPEVGWLKSYGLHPSRKLHYGLPLFDKRSKSFQVEPFMSGAEASRRWMMERGRWSKHQSVATGADFATDVWISHLCTPEPPPCPPPSSDEADWQCHSYQRGENLDWCQQVGTVGCVTYAVQNFSEEMSSCGKCDCCRKLVAQLPTGPKQTCCILFNDLLLNYTVTPDLSLCTPQPVKLAPAWTMSPDTAFQVRSRCGEDSGPVVVQERQATEESEDTACAPSESSSLEIHLAVAAWSALLVILLLCHAPSRIYLSIVRQASRETNVQAGGPCTQREEPEPAEEPEPPEPETPQPAPTKQLTAPGSEGSEAGRHVVFASIEHVVPERNVNACTGDTGIFLDLMEEHPPGTLSMVHPILAADYGELDWYSELAVVVDGKIQAVQVLRLECEKNEGSHKVVWYFLKHELFLDRTQESLYPEPLSKLRSLRFYSLWNQSVAMLLETLKPEVFHCMDWHQALAPLYLDTACQIPMVLLLRQGAMGSVDSESLSDRFWKTVSPLRRMSLVFNLKIPTIRRYCIFEGRFNMLKAGIQFISETQHGRGICVLSAASTLRREHRLLQGYKLRALGQPSLRLACRDASRSIETMKKQRESARRALQQHAGLKGGGKVLLFTGPWAWHAGAEQIAEVVPQILCRHEEAQVLLCGLCSDLYGLMAQDVLSRVMAAFPGRIHFLSERFELSEELRAGVDFLLAPFLAEPVGQRDLELGALGVPTVGCASGAAGRMPGIYFRQQHSSAEMLKSGFFCALDYALTMPEEEYWELAKAATEAPQARPGAWSDSLHEAYQEVIFKRRCPKAHFDDCFLWKGSAASQEDLQMAMAPRRSSALRRVSSTADLAHQMQVLDIDEDAEFLTQPVSESRAQEIMKAVAESLPHLSDHMDATNLQQDIAQARQRLEERHALTRGLMKPFAGLCLRIHLVMAACYVTSSVGELLLQTLEVEGIAGHFVPSAEIWLSFFGAFALGCVLWLRLSFGIPPNLLMTVSQGLNLAAFLLLPLLPEHQDTNWSYICFAAVSGVQSSSRLLYLIWNFNEEMDHGFQVAIWRLGLLEALRRSVAWIALVATFAGKLWLYKQVLFVVAFILLVLLFKAPYCYATNVLPGTGFQWLRNRSFLLLLVSEVFNSLSCYAAQDVPQWLTLNGWKVSEIEILVLIVAASLPLLLHLSFRALRRMQVWGPWALRDFACCLPAGTLLRAIAMHNSGGQSRSKIFLAALALSVLVDAMRYTAILSAMMTVLGSKWNALKGCYLAACLSAAAAAASPWVSQWVAQQISGISLDLEEEVLPDDPAALGKATISAVLPLALTGYVFQVAAAFFFNQEVLTFKGHGSFLPDGSGDACSSTRWFWVAKVRRHMAAAKAALSKRKDVSRAEELALDQVQAAIEESFMPTLLSPKGGAKHWDSSPKSVMPMEEEEGEEEVPNERNDIMNARQLLAKGAEAEKWTSGAEKDATTKSVASFDVQTEMVTPSHEESCAEDKEQEAEPWTSGMPDKDATTTKSVASFDVQMEIVTPDEDVPMHLEQSPPEEDEEDEEDEDEVPLELEALPCAEELDANE